MHDGNEIHPTAIVDADVRMGRGNVIGPFCVLHGPIELGDGNRIGPCTVIGTRGDEIWQRDHDATGKRIRIGSRCVIREHVTIHKPVYGETTVLGDEVYLMHGAYVAHDSRLGDGAVLAQNAAIGGLSRVLERGYVAMGAVLHQQAVCGPYSIVAAAAAAVRSVRPFSRFVPGQPATVNSYAIDRYGFEAHRDEVEAYVVEGTLPTEARLRDLVLAYDRQVADGGRGEYGRPGSGR